MVTQLKFPMKITLNNCHISELLLYIETDALGTYYSGVRARAVQLRRK